MSYYGAFLLFALLATAPKPAPVADPTGWHEEVVRDLERVQTGMTLPEVQAALGRSGQLVHKKGRVQDYQWSQSDGTSLVVTFESGRVTTRTIQGWFLGNSGR